MSRRIILWSFILFLLVGCSLFSVTSQQPKQLLLLSPKGGPSAVLLKQKVTMDARGEQHQFLVVIRLEHDQLKLRALLPTGQPLLSLDYDGVSLQQTNNSPIALPSEEILAMMQFALWSEKAIEKAYRTENGWQLELSSEQRLLFMATEKVVSVNYLSNDEMLIENYDHQYRVIIKTLETTTL